MLGLISSVEDVDFDIEMALEEQRGIQPLPFPKMDKSSASICKFFQRGVCYRDISCPFRHTSGPKTVVCKHWLRGLCKKGDDCEYLHEYDMTKMPECYFFSKYGECSNKDCQYLHIDPNSKLRDCPWYDRGFCKHGPTCRNRHIRRVMCTNYMSGFCPLGPKCKSMHPRFELPKVERDTPKIKCHHCNEPGHIITHCPLKNVLPNHPTNTMAHPALKPRPDRSEMGMMNGNMPMTSSAPDHRRHHSQSEGGAAFDSTLVPVSQGQQSYTAKPLSTVTCFKCGEKGHYANNCALAKKNLNLSNTGGFKIQ